MNLNFDLHFQSAPPGYRQFMDQNKVGIRILNFFLRKITHEHHAKADSEYIFLINYQYFLAGFLRDSTSKGSDGRAYS